MNHLAIVRAQLLYQQGRHEQAADACREVLSQDPQDPHAHALLALCLVKQQKFQEASEEAAMGIHAAPDMAFCHYAAGMVYLERNRFAEAETAARSAIDNSPEDPDYWSLLSAVLIAQKKWRDAAEAAEQGLSFDPEHVACANNRAMALVQLGEKDRASQTITEVLSRNPHNAFSHANQGWTALHAGDTRKALEHFSESLRLDPESEWARDGMAQALKARFRIYRYMLRYYLWMSRFNERSQWGLIIGLWLAFQVVRSINRSYPALAPVTYPLMGGYMLFALASWLCVPIFNLSLMATTYGRYLLPRQQRIGALLVGILLLVGLSLTVAAWVDDKVVPLLIGMLMLAMTFPVMATSSSQPGPATRLMTLYSLLMGFIGLLVVGATVATGDPPQLFFIVLLACMLSNVVSAVVSRMTFKK